MTIQYTGNLIIHEASKKRGNYNKKIIRFNAQGFLKKKGQIIVPFYIFRLF